MTKYYIRKAYRSIVPPDPYSGRTCDEAGVTPRYYEAHELEAAIKDAESLSRFNNQFRVVAFERHVKQTDLLDAALVTLVVDSVSLEDGELKRQLLANLEGCTLRDLSVTVRETFAPYLEADFERFIDIQWRVIIDIEDGAYGARQVWP